MHLVHAQLNKLNTQLGGSISKLEGDRILQCHNDKGIGKVVSVSLEEGISYTEYNLNLVENTDLELDNTSSSTLYFIYALKGNMAYSWKNDIDCKKKIQELQTVILGSRTTSLIIHVPKESKTSFAVIKVDKSNSFQSDTTNGEALSQKLFHQFLGMSDVEPYEYHGTFNLRIREQLLQIRAIRDTGVVRKLLVKGIIHFALALELKHHQSDLKKKNGLQTKLTKNELIRIKEATDTIAKKPELPYTVSQLCREYGLSAAKLQEGFKVLEGCTVSNYIKRQRVEMAERLIKEGDLNISEVVYTIGFTSRSYFSKIFRKRYNCTPKYYQERCKHVTSA